MKLCEIIPSWGSTDYYVQWHISENIIINSYASPSSSYSNTLVLYVNTEKEDWKQSLPLQEQK